MHSAHVKNTIRYYIVIVIALIFLFFSGNFGLIDVQKTALIMAVGLDREEDTFIVTSQIAIPQSSKQGKASQTVQIVSRGKTVADAFEEINAKTGWYPKLVFCKLLVVGEKTAEQDVFDALGFFLLDEYMSDNCLVATCDGTAKDMLNVTALVDPSGSVAMQKVLSPHAERVGTVLPATLREFAIGYFSDGKSGYLPILKTQPQQEQIGDGGGGGSASEGESGGQSGQSGQGGQSSGSQSNGQSSGTGSESGSQASESGGQDEQDKPVFSAGETALFYAGKRVGKWSVEETFAFNAVEHELRLAAYSVEEENAVCTLTIKRNGHKNKLVLGADGRPTIKLEITMAAGLLDNSKALPLESVRDVGDVPEGAFAAAEKLLTAQISSAFEKCRACGCDLFGVREKLQKYESRRYEALKDEALKNALADIKVTFRNVR
ncbi:MAG: hypothetical protein IJ514_02105 [Clostridia bacterium]|nr:hypothetical protein [Clostridia bacterium]